MARFRLTKIYTRTGDDGSTGLGGGQRVDKDDPRIEAYGTVDELNSFLGAALAQSLDPRLKEMCLRIQNDLFDAGSDLCMLERDKEQYKIPSLDDMQVRQLEVWIDALQESLGPLENFILPGGSVGSSNLQICRVVCRRAERCVIALRKIEAIGAFTLKYLNRLSDLFFVMARYENLKQNVSETQWEQKARAEK